MLIKSEHNGHMLEHDEEQHLYLLDGKQLDGVTSLLSLGYPKSRGIYDWQTREGAKWAIEAIGDMSPKDLTKEQLDAIIKETPVAYKKALEEAADIGTTVHDYCYKIEKGLPVVLDGLNPHYDIINRCCEQFDDWKSKLHDDIIFLEELVCSPEYQYAGRFDRLANRDGVVTLTDYKTSSSFYITQFIQMAAYAIAIEEWLGIEVQDIEIVRFDKKTGKLSTRNLLQLANTVSLKPTTVLKKLKEQFKCVYATCKFIDKFDRYIRK